MRICMDWRSVKFDWNKARAFLVTAEEGSLSAAARALDLSQPTLGRQVSALEEELGVTLFERVGKGLTLTEGGQALLEQVRDMGDAASRFSLSALGQNESLEGTVCISASEVTAAFTLTPLIQKLQKEAPGIQIELVASNAVSDLNRREADIAIRAFRPAQPDLIIRKLKNQNARMYATPDYLARLGSPTTPAQVNAAEFIGFADVAGYIEAMRCFGLQLTRRSFPITTANHLVQWELVKQGAGIGIMPDDIGDLEPAVCRVLPEVDPFDIELWLVVHQELRTNRRIRYVFDFLAAELGEG